MKKRQKMPQIFECIECNFKCSKNSEFERHKLTAKHKRLSNPNKKTPNLYSCICGKSYKHQSTLCAHKKICEKWRFFLMNPKEKTRNEHSSYKNEYNTNINNNANNNQYNDDISEISEETFFNALIITKGVFETNAEIATYLTSLVST